MGNRTKNGNFCKISASLTIWQAKLGGFFGLESGFLANWWQSFAFDAKPESKAKMPGKRMLEPLGLDSQDQSGWSKEKPRRTWVYGIWT